MEEEVAKVLASSSQCTTTWTKGGCEVEEEEEEGFVGISYKMGGWRRCRRTTTNLWVGEEELMGKNETKDIKLQFYDIQLIMQNKE